MTSTAKVIADSVGDRDIRLITYQLRYPRLVHAEAKTHRIVSANSEEVIVLTGDDAFMSDPMLSRNASSSRAIPVAKMIQQVREDPAMPVHWGANQPGMQARAEVDDIAMAQLIWRKAAWEAADRAEKMMKLGLHKQVANRILEPFQYISVIATATEWDGFFELRDHEDADPNIADLARVMKTAMLLSIPQYRQVNNGKQSWHLPYVTPEERDSLPIETLLKLSTARCARVSYLTHDGLVPSIEKDIELYERLVGSRPLHASPTEHQAKVCATPFFYKNFRGWTQHRSMVETML